MPPAGRPGDRCGQPGRTGADRIAARLRAGNAYRRRLQAEAEAQATAGGADESELGHLGWLSVHPSLQSRLRRLQAMGAHVDPRDLDDGRGRQFWIGLAIVGWLALSLVLFLVSAQLRAGDLKTGGGARTGRVRGVLPGVSGPVIRERDLDVPLIILSQLNRAPDARPDKHPMLSDLRESGSLEQDADVVLFLYRDEVYHNVGNCTVEKKSAKSCPRCGNNSGVAEVIIGKQRNGAVGTVKARWIGEYMRFENLPRAAA